MDSEQFANKNYLNKARPASQISKSNAKSTERTNGDIRCTTVLATFKTTRGLSPINL